MVVHRFRSGHHIRTHMWAIRADREVVQGRSNYGSKPDTTVDKDGIGTFDSVVGYE